MRSQRTASLSGSRQRAQPSPTTTPRVHCIATIGNTRGRAAYPKSLTVFMADETNGNRSSGAGFTRRQTSSTRCPRLSLPRPRAIFTRSGSPKPGRWRPRPSTTSWRSTGRSTRGHAAVSRRTATSSSPSTTSRPSTGATRGRPTHRKHILDDPPAASAHEGQRIEEGQPDHDVQARSVGQPTLAETQRASPDRSCSRRKNLHRRSPAKRRLIQDLRTQLSTIAARDRRASHSAGFYREPAASLGYARRLSPMRLCGSAIG